MMSGLTGKRQCSGSQSPRIGIMDLTLFMCFTSISKGCELRSRSSMGMLWATLKNHIKNKCYRPIRT